MNSETARLYYLIGPSGVGKDTVLAAVRDDTSAVPGLRVARRYITRPPRGGAEQHIEVTAAEFERARRQGEYLFAWESHGFGYAVGHDILGWLAAGDDVIVNGSRAYLETARAIYPGLQPIWMTVSENLLRERLIARGRESAAQIEQRILRNRALEDLFRSEYSCIRNDDSIAQALAGLEEIRHGGDGVPGNT